MHNQLWFSWWALDSFRASCSCLPPAPRSHGTDAHIVHLSSLDAVLSYCCTFWHSCQLVQLVLMEDEISRLRCSCLCLRFAPSVLQTCLSIQSKHICDPCRGHMSKCSLQVLLVAFVSYSSAWLHRVFNRNRQFSGLWQKRAWKCLGLNTNWIHLFSNIFQLYLPFVPCSLKQRARMTVSSLPLRWWWRGEEV